MITVRVEKIINFNGQEIRKTAEAEMPDGYPWIDVISAGLMRSISLPESALNIPTPPKPREWWIIAPKGELQGFNRATVYACSQALVSNQIEIHVREISRRESAT